MRDTETPNSFEQFVQKVAAVPKEAVEQIEAERVKRPSRKRLKAKNPPIRK